MPGKPPRRLKEETATTLKKKKQKKYREKTLQEHAEDGIVLILKSFRTEDQKLYHVMKGTLKVNFMGTKQRMVVMGEATLGFFDIKTKGHRTGIPVNFRYEGFIAPDSWGVDTMNLVNFELYGLDGYEGPTVPVVLNP